VAVADVNHDGVSDIITAPGPTGGPHIRVFSGVDGRPLSGPVGSFLAYDSRFTGGVTVAAADVNNDGFADIITGADAGAAPHVKVFSGKDGTLLKSFLAFDGTFAGGVNVAGGD